MAALLATILRRLVLGLPTLFGVVVVSFALTRLLPGDPAVYFAGAAPTPEAIADLRRTLLLDRPLPQQFAAYLSDLLHGNLGRSLVTGQPVLQDLSTRFPATLELTLTAIALALVIAVPLGVAGAMRKGSAIDHVARMVSTTALSLPSFFTGLLLVFVFYYLMGIAPAPLGRLAPMSFPPPERTGFMILDAALARDWAACRDAAAHLLLPALALAIAGVGPLTRVTRSAMLAVLSSDFIRAARAYDLPRWKLVYAYALRNAMLPVLTTAGVVFSFLISANVVVEKVFSWPGIGSYALEALVGPTMPRCRGSCLPWRRCMCSSTSPSTSSTASSMCACASEAEAWRSLQPCRMDLQRDPLTAVTAGFLVAVCVMALIGPWLTVHDPLATDAANALKPPSLRSPCGTTRSGATSARASSTRPASICSSRRVRWGLPSRSGARSEAWPDSSGGGSTASPCGWSIPSWPSRCSCWRWASWPRSAAASRTSFTQPLS